MRDVNDDKVEVVLINGRRAFVSRENITDVFRDNYMILFVLIATFFYACLPVDYSVGAVFGLIIQLFDAVVTGFAIIAVLYVICINLNLVMVKLKVKRKFYFTPFLIIVTAIVEYFRQLVLMSVFGVESNYLGTAAAKIIYAVLLELIFSYFVIDKVKGWVEETDRSFVFGPQIKPVEADEPEASSNLGEMFLAADTHQMVRFGNTVFLAREVLMIEAQQHYIDVTTPTKVHRLRFRLKDATAMMPDRLGWLANRSTWVAYDLISGVKPISDGRASLTLFSGGMVIVPRGRQGDLNRLNAILQQRDAAQNASSD